MLQLNPPAPKCVHHKRCLQCGCVPKFWRLDVAAFGSYIDSWIVLEAEPEPDSTRCIWDNRLDIPQGTSTERTKAAGDFFADHGSWHLGTVGRLDADVESPTTLFQEWVAIGDSNFPSGIGGNAAYTRQAPFGANSGQYPAGSTFGHFRCLHPNRLYYQGSDLDGDGDTDANSLGWPYSILVTPYWP